MKRIYLAVAAAFAVLAVAAPATMASAETSVNVKFSADFYSATITSDKGVSNYEYVLCDGTTKKVELGGGGGLLSWLIGGSSADKNNITIGPFSSQIVSVRVKAGKTDELFASHVDCGAPEDPDPK